jgi:hypothetical protein
MRTDVAFDSPEPLYASEWQAGIAFANGAALPLRPIWPAFLTNAVFWAGATWFVFIGLRAVRRKIALKPGHCPHCRYDARGLTQCPECGTFLIISKQSG